MKDSEHRAQSLLLGLVDALPRNGKAFAYVKVPHSSNLSAYGFIPIPVVVIANGNGPTVLLLSGTNGDEYEGQVALSRLAREIRPEEIKGRIIIVPTANVPAAQAGSRNSPLDGLNLNRSYPGNVLGSPTEAIASYLETALMREADVVVDLHSGGRSLIYEPCATIMDHTNSDERERRLALAYAFGGDIILLSQGYEERNASGAARRSGAVRIGVELGGGERLEHDLVEFACMGVRNMLTWAGVLPQRDRKRGYSRARVLCVDQARDLVYARGQGLFEAAVGLGTDVDVGALAGQVHDPINPLTPPHELYFETPGRIVATRGHGSIQIGDCLLHLAMDYEEAEPGELDRAWASRWLRDSMRGQRSRRPKQSANGKLKS